ncbi:RagB/SusD family nutrient uptake outer membrane protein [Bacteroides sp. 214]|uniref:RagB/SusD family nutrient uptake outer membrane protein n=1 Tax=Bacteroides sp. 214 TaxID=2302935 RepID=UPI0013D702E2|nr:RagB/SusD family nutrient uptake outer membrane protein [Bacteroides sp. 214]NDW12838.1 RagB/SusD family nutrient uptake outer membrane protein [Bacteroides sp. 214]
MKFNITKKILPLLLLGASMSYTSCTLDETNPSGSTLETVSASTITGYEGILNNIYFGMQRRMYGYGEWTTFTEAGTDLWTPPRGFASNYFNYGMGGGWNTNMMLNFLNPAYDGVGSCNVAIKYAPLAPYATDAERNAKVAEAHFMRAIYYYNLVEQFGGITLHLEPATKVDLHPSKNEPMEIYEKCIIPDLEFAAEWLPTEECTTRPSKKSAMGFLCRAYLQTREYGDHPEYMNKALELAKRMIADCEGGGSQYGVQMYANLEDVFSQENNYGNTEALWKHRFVSGGSSNNAWILNENNKLFNCLAKQFGVAMQMSKNEHSGNRLAGKTDHEIWGTQYDGGFMPSGHLLKLYVQADGTLDPRYYGYFQTSWYSNKDKGGGWSDSYIKTYDKDKTSEGIYYPYTDPTTGVVTYKYTRIEFDELAIRFIHPSEPDYAEMLANKDGATILIVDYNDVYAADGYVKQEYTRKNDGETVVNPWAYFYPGMTKFNSNNFIRTNSSKLERVGNLNSTFMMRTPEVYLIAAEADIYVNGGANAMGYINKVRARAGAKALTGTADIQTVLDERARELCGEYVRFYDLKRTKKLTKAYLLQTNPGVGQYFDDSKHMLREFPSGFLETLQEGGWYYQNPNY